MKLSEQDSKLFFKLMRNLHFYANRKLKIYPEVQSFGDYVGLDQEQKMKLRNALFDNVKIIDSFVRDNPNNYSREELHIISSWKSFIRDHFFIERILKKCNIFIRNNEVYAVSALMQGIDEVSRCHNLPLYVDTILLPFKGKIVYDGFLNLTSMSFGGNIAHGLKEKYMRAKQNNRIIDTLEAPSYETEQLEKSQTVKSWEPELEKLTKQAKRLKGSVNSPAVHGAAFSLVKASIEFARLAVSSSRDRDELRKALEKVRRTYNKSSTVLYRED
ncbi:MAG: hypothetical protein PHV82_16300 [Victivallaceae bacterium]|nr:hypothetical protein [Victivallaceae bacterium]